MTVKGFGAKNTDFAPAFLNIGKICIIRYR